MILLLNTLPDCLDILNSGENGSGVYNITLGSVTIPVRCDMETDGGGWTVSKNDNSYGQNNHTCALRHGNGRRGMDGKWPS